MLKKILIFKQGKTKNEEYLLKYLHKFAKDKYRCFVSHYDDIEFLLPNKGDDKIKLCVSSQGIESFDLVFFRNWGRRQPLATALARYLQARKRKFIDEAVALPTHGHKLSQTTLLQLHNLPTPSTIFISRKLIKSKANFIAKTLKLPLIMKDVKGSKGEDNHLIKHEEEIPKVLKKAPEEMEFLFQEFIPNQFDYRFVVLGDKVGAVEKRIRQDPNIHQNNAALGAKEVFINPDTVEKLNPIAVKAAKIFERQVAGVDIVVSDKTKKPYILEVNPSPGFTYDIKISPEVKMLSEYLGSLV